MRLTMVLALAASLAGCGMKYYTFDVKPAEQKNDMVTVRVLGAGNDRYCYGIGVVVENNSDSTLMVDIQRASIILSTGEAIPALVPTVYRSEASTKYNTWHKLLSMAAEIKTRKHLESGPLPPGSWRDGALFFPAPADGANVKLVLDHSLPGGKLDPVDIVVTGQGKRKEMAEGGRTFLGTYRGSSKDDND